MVEKLINSKKLVIIFLILIGFLTYFSSFNNEFVWDDDHFIRQNIFVQSLSYIKQIFTSNTIAGAGVASNYYRPITTLSFAIDHQIWGFNVFGFHLTNTLLHITNGILIFLLLAGLNLKRIIAFLVALIFIIHPIQTEAVTYLSSRGDLLYTLFLLTSLLLFTKSIYSKKVFVLVPAFLLYPFSILSKEAALASFPLYLGILLIYKVKKKLSLRSFHQQFRKQFIFVGLIFLASILYFIIRLTVLEFSDTLNYSGEFTLYTQNLLIRIYTFLKIILIYVSLLIYPYPLYLDRTTEIVTSISSWWVLGSLSLIFSVLLLCIWEQRKNHTSWIYFGILIAATNLIPVSGIIPQTGLLRENWLYLPMIGFYLIIFTTINLFLNSLVKTYKTFAAILIALISIIYIVMTINQNYNWKDRITYFEHNLKFHNTARLHLNLGNAYLGKNELDKAKLHLDEAIKLGDIYPQTHYNLGMVYQLEGDYLKAEDEYLTSLRLDPNYLFAYPLLIELYSKTNKPKDSLPYLKKLLVIYPNDLKLTLMYAENLFKAGELKKADEEFNKALVLSNNDPKLKEAISESKRQFLDGLVY